jgi:SNF family Na+-dependent transporter
MAFLGVLTGLGTLIVWWFSKDLKALDTIDFWIGTVGIFVQGMILIIVYAWYIGIEPGWRETHTGSAMRIPAFYKVIMRYIAPTFLLVVFVMFIAANVFGWNFSFGEAARFNPTSYVTDLVGPNPSAVARGAFGFVAAVVLLIAGLIHVAGKNWARQEGETNP